MDTKYIYKILSKDITSFGCYIWGIEFFGRQRSQTLRIYIDSEKGISIEDCEKVSKHIIKVLDTENDFSSKYLLEVSSPGLDRKLFEISHYSAYIGGKVKISLKAPFEQRRNYLGVLTRVEQDEVVIESEEEEFTFPFETIERGHLVYEE